MSRFIQPSSFHLLLFGKECGPLTPIISTSSSPYTNFGDPAINASGQVAFLANLPGGGSDILYGSGSNLEDVMSVGSSLFGSTVTGLNLWNTGLNSDDQLAFWFSLSNGLQGIALADFSVPEPSSLTLVATGLAGLGLGTLSRRGRHGRTCQSTSRQ